MDRSKARVLSAAVKAALVAVSDAHGVRVEVSAVRYGATDVRMRVELFDGAAADAVAAARLKFERYLLRRTAIWSRLLLHVPCRPCARCGTWTREPLTLPLPAARADDYPRVPQPIYVCADCADTLEERDGTEI